MINGEILENNRLKGDYFLVRFHAPEICAKARAGQFVHVRINDHGDRILRRPFSIHDCAGETLSLVYKVVGHGTKELSELAPGAVCDLLGPLGVGFSDPAPGMTPVLVAGDTVRQRLTCSQSRSRSADSSCSEPAAKATCC